MKIYEKLNTFFKVRDYLAERNCLLLEEYYLGYQIPINYSCNICKRKFTNSFKEICIKKACTNCETTNKEEDLKKLFEKYGCTFIKYKNCVADFKCKCGKVTKKRLPNFKTHPECLDCTKNTLKQIIVNKYVESLKTINFTLIEYNGNGNMKAFCNNCHKIMNIARRYINNIKCC